MLYLFVATREFVRIAEFCCCSKFVLQKVFVKAQCLCHAESSCCTKLLFVAWRQLSLLNNFVVLASLTCLICLLQGTSCLAAEFVFLFDLENFIVPVSLSSYILLLLYNYVASLYLSCSYVCGLISPKSKFLSAFVLLASC